MRILVVDDKFDSRWGIADWLVAFLEAVTVESAASAAEALQLLERCAPDVVLATHAMAETEALELAQRIKSRPAPPVVIVLTERSDPEFDAACEAAGVDFWLEKHQLQGRLLAFLKERFAVEFIQPRVA
jgi:CheY-like chemotaxis protein